jgi:hypothetical protein
MSNSTRRSIPNDRTSKDAERVQRERRGERAGVVVLPVTTPAVAADEVADLALRLRARLEAEGAPLHCDACDALIEGEPGGSGLYVWPGDVDAPRVEEPPLCQACATAIGVVALRSFEEPEEEG